MDSEQETLLALGMDDVVTFQEQAEYERDAEIALLVLTSEMAYNPYMLIICIRGLKDMSEWPPEQLDEFLDRFGHHGAEVAREDIHEAILERIPPRVLEHLGLEE